MAGARESSTSQNSNVEVMSLAKASNKTLSEEYHTSRSTISTCQPDEIPFIQLSPKIEQLCVSIWSQLVQEPKAHLPLETEGPKSLAQRLLGYSDNRLVRRLRSRSTRSSTLCANRKVNIERMNSGTYNRIVAVTIPKTGGLERQFILRISREQWHSSTPERDVAILRYVQERTTIPVANLVAFDFSRNNPLNSPYVVQSRIPGKDLVRHDQLTDDQWIDFAKQLGQIMLQLQEVQNQFPGRVELQDQNEGLGGFAIRPLEVKSPFPEGHDGFDQYKDLASTWSPAKIEWLYSDHRNFLTTQLARWRAEELHRLPLELTEPDIYRQLAETAAEMDECLCLGEKFRDNRNALCHLDLRGRNIMVQVQSNGKLKVTGILDWDSALFAPFWVGCAPPHWLWAPEDCENYDEDDETNASKLPEKELDQKVQAAWEEVVGEKFLRFSYEPEYRLARKIFHFSLHGVQNSWERSEAEDLIEQWRPLHAKYTQLRAEIEQGYDDGSKHDEKIEDNS